MDHKQKRDEEMQALEARVAALEKIAMIGANNEFALSDEVKNTKLRYENALKKLRKILLDSEETNPEHLPWRGECQNIIGEFLCVDYEEGPHDRETMQRDMERMLYDEADAEDAGVWICTRRGCRTNTQRLDSNFCPRCQKELDARQLARNNGGADRVHDVIKRMPLTVRCDGKDVVVNRRKEPK